MIAPVKAAGPRTCPTCGQSTQNLRYGVRFPHSKVRIFDAISAAGSIGITSEGVIRVAYEGEEKPNITSIKAHIFQINEMLDGTGMRIVSEREDRENRFWVLVKRKRREE